MLEARRMKNDINALFRTLVPVAALAVHI